MFVGDDEDLDQDATVEIFMLVAGLSSIAFGAIFNLPFIVAPSVLYAAREAGYVRVLQCTVQQYRIFFPLLCSSMHTVSRNGRFDANARHLNESTLVFRSVCFM